MRVETAMVEPAELTESQIVADCLELMERESDCKWGIGRHAHDWTQRHAKGRTDADFANLVGLSREQVTMRRQVWAMYGDQSNTGYKNLSWSHYRAVLTWSDAEEWLAEAEANKWPVAMMTQMRSVRERMDRGDDLTEPADDDDGDDIQTRGQAEGFEDAEHVADADPYQKPPSIVVSTPRDFPDDPEPPAENVARQPEQAAWHEVISHAIESITDLVEAAKQAGGMERKLFAAKLRRWADEIDED